MTLSQQPHNYYQLIISPLTISHCEQICSWRYDAPYDCYQWPSWNDMQTDGIEFADPVIRASQYTAVLTPSGELIGFAQFFPMVDVTRIGLSLRPDLCSRGIGPHFVRLLAEEAHRRNPLHTIDLEVYSWNTRAIRAYERAGFHVSDDYERLVAGKPEHCVCMVWKLD